MQCWPRQPAYGDVAAALACNSDTAEVSSLAALGDSVHVCGLAQVSAFAPSFQGCGGIEVGDLTRIEFDNYSGEVQDFCVDQVWPMPSN